VKRKMLSMKSSTSLPSSSRKYRRRSAVSATRARPGGPSSAEMSAALLFSKSLMSMTPDSGTRARGRCPRGCARRRRRTPRRRVLLRKVVDQLLDDDGLATPRRRTARSCRRAGRLEEVDDLDPGLEHLEGGRLVDEGGAGRWIGSRFSHFTGPSSSTGSPMTLRTRPSVPGPTGTVIGPPVSTAGYRAPCRRSPAC